MLKRFLKALGRSPSPGGGEERNTRTYGERLLDVLLARVAERAESHEGQAELLIADLLVEQEEDSLPDGASRDARRLYGRSLLPLLLDNDALPPALQLEPRDLDAPRALLRSFFFEQGDMQEQASHLLKFIEQRFAGEQFGQAAILLELFDSESSTQRHNELNLFYEAMLVRLNGRRSRPFGAEARRRWSAMQESAGESDVGAVLTFLEEQAGVRFHVRHRDPDECARWSAALPEALDERGRRTLLERIPPARWRRAPRSSEDLQEMLESALDDRALRAHVADLTRVAYFVARTVGRTGFESVLTRYVRWVAQTFPAADAQTVLPGIHLGTLNEDMLFSEVIDGAASGLMAARASGSLALGPDAVEQAVAAATRSLLALTPADLPEGEYDLGALILDHLVGFAPVAELPLTRMRRLL